MKTAGVPTTPDQVLDPDWLTFALGDACMDGRIVAVEAVGSSKTLAEKLRFKITVERNGQRHQRFLCAKAHLDGSSGADIIVEALFYRDLAPRLEVRMPAIYHAAADPSTQEAIILMDDVTALGGHFLSAHNPYSVDTTRDTLGQLARLHAATWNGRQTEGCHWLAPRAAGMTDMISVDALETLLNDGRGHGIAPDLLKATKVIEAMRRTAAHDITCVIHGDAHSGNSYLDQQGRASWLDWQCAQLGNWATDVSYHLATVLDVESRRAHEEQLLRHYLNELQSLGVEAPTWADAWDLYSLSFSYGYFLWAITRISSREVVLLHIPRLAAALTDHDTFRRLGVS